MSNLSSTESSVLKTLVYFDIFDYPLTLVEIWRYLYQVPEISLLEVQKVLENSENLKKFIETRKGFYFLKGRSDLINIRLERYNIANSKFKKARKMVKLLRFIPFIGLVAVCNNLGYNNATEKSDIDLFLITSPKRIWTARFYSFLLLKLLGQRPKEGKSKDKICISVFVTEDKMNLKELMLDEEDIHFVYWLSQFVPLYDQKNIWPEFVKANLWARQYLANSYFYSTNPKRSVKPSRFIKKFKEVFHFGALGDFLEKLYKKIQLKVMPQVLKNMANQSTRVVINDQVLKFHSNDRRAEYRSRYLKKLEELEI